MKMIMMVVSIKNDMRVEEEVYIRKKLPIIVNEAEAYPIIDIFKHTEEVCAEIPRNLDINNENWRNMFIVGVGEFSFQPF